MSNTYDYSTLFYLNPFPNWVYDIDTFEILDVNQAAIDLYGYSKEEFLTLTIKELRPKEEIPKVIAVHEGIDKHKGNKHYGTFTHKKKDGTIFRVETNGHRVEFQGKNCFMVVCQDVTVKEKLFRQSQEAMYVMNASMDVICSIDENGNFISVSQAAVDVWGYQPQELVGKAYLDLVHEEDLELTRQTAIDIMSGKAVTTFENRYLKKNGEVAYNIWSARWDPTTQIMYAIARDGNEKRKADEILAESEKRFRVLIQEGSDLIAILDAEGNYKYVSPTSLAVLGFTPEEFLGKSPFEFIHPEDAEKAMQSLGKIATDNKVTVEPFRFKNKDGEWHWIETVLTNMLEHPSIQGIVANSRDITDKKKEEQHLKLLQSVVTNTNDAILITEAEPQNEPGPRIVYVNEAFTRMTGYTADEVIGQSPRMLQGPKTDKKELARLGKALRNWQPCEVTTLNYKKNGEEFWINFTVSPVADEKGWYTHWIAIERDVTAAKNEQFQKDFLANISAVFNDGIDLNISLERLCELIANYGDFSLCEIWLPTIHQKALKLLSRVEMDATAKKFYTHVEDTEEIGFDKGLPGKVWKSKDFVVWGDADIEEFFIRNNAAKSAGLKSVLGIPLTHQEKIVGVMVVGTKEDVGNMERFRSMLTEMESFIGSKINRKRLESDLHHLFDTLPDIICIADLNGHFLKINRAGCELLGFEEHQIVGHSFEKFTHPLDKTVFINEIKKLKKGETILNFENRYITKKNDTIWLSWHCNFIKEEGVIYATAKNITNEKKLREVASNASEMATIGGWEIDLINNKLTWSEVVHQIYETDPNTYIPEVSSSINFYREDYQEYVVNIVQKAIDTGEYFDFQAALVTSKGNEKWVRAVGKAEIVNGTCVRVFGSFQDITQIKETEHRLQTITDDLPGVTFQYYIYPDNTNKLVSVSKASYKIWGLSPEACEKDNDIVWDQIKNGGDYEALVNDIQHSIATLSQWHSKWRNVLPNGELRWHEGYGTPYSLPDGTILFNSMIFDITDKVNVAQLYEEATELAKIGSWEFDLLSKDESKTLYWSPMVKKIMEVDDNYNPSLTGGREFYKPESKDLIEKVGEVLIKEGTQFDEELQIVTKRGKEKWIRIIAKSEHINGVCTKIFGSIQDIHAMKTTEVQLKEILGSISDAFLALDEHWNFTYFNKEAENLINRKSSEVLGKNLWEELPYIKGTELERVYHRVAKSRKPETFEFLSPKSGTWVEINMYPSVGGISVYFKNIDERRNTAEALQNAYQEKIKIIESIGDAFFTINRDFTVTYWNKTAEKLLGVKRETLVGKNLWEAFPEAVNLPSYANYHKVMETGEPIMFEDYYGVWLEVNAYPSAEGISVFFRDITHRKEADDRLLKAYDEKNQILESIGDAFFALDKDWIVTYWNKEAETVLGRKRDVILGKNLWEEYADAIDSDFYRQYHQAAATGKTVSFEEFYPALNKWFEVTAYPSPKGLSVYFKDVTLRKETDIRILQANERFEKVTKATTDAIWDWDIENDIFYRGEGFEKLFGYDVNKTLKGDAFWKDSFHPKDLPGIQTSLYECLQDSEAEYWRHEYRIVHKSGEEKTVIDKGVVIRNEKGKAIRMVGAITDITHRVVYEKEILELNKVLKKKIKELEISNEELEQFAFIASHDLQEPLRMISSFLNQIQRKYGDQLDDKAHQYINFATDGAKRMKQIILDLLDYSKAGKLADNLELINLNKLIEEYGILRRRLIQEKRATIIVNNLPNVKCFRAPLVQTLHCLLDNALNYSREKVPPVIKISTLETETNWQVSIEDNGIGIDPEFFDKIFIIFQRLHNRDKYEGTGIGLSIAKKHIEYWGGKIWVESELDKGSTFYFTIDKNIEI
ncbi:PAS domain S-box protein [Confluentibacter citreus]|uniref:PAS domain S-box protein n=1 Tax=Confluentibacter citreus TaxID=2007307 RepID=UPI000C289E08|nr:PAS domain S-box protein [Confluentibacter citreus]